MDTLSIVIPVYNRRALLEEALDSVLRYAPARTQVVVVDDYSNEDLASIHSRASARASLVEMKYVVKRMPARRGAQVARNAGLEAADGPLIMFMDSDDTLEEGGVQALVKALQDPFLEFAHGRVRLVDSQNSPLGVPDVGGPYQPQGRAFGDYHWHTMGAVYRRTLLQRVGPWAEGLTGSQDWEFQARVKLRRPAGTFVNVLVGNWRQHAGDRVGATKFRADYIDSVYKACLLIESAAREAGEMNRALGELLARKLALHAVEYGANGRLVEKVELLGECARLTSPRALYWGLSAGLRWSPAWLDRFLLALGSRRVRRCSR